MKIYDHHDNHIGYHGESCHLGGFNFILDMKNYDDHNHHIGYHGDEGLVTKKDKNLILKMNSNNLFTNPCIGILLLCQASKQGGRWWWWPRFIPEICFLCFSLNHLSSTVLQSSQVQKIAMFSHEILHSLQKTTQWKALQWNILQWFKVCQFWI